MMNKHIRNCICVLLLAAAAFFLDGCSFRPESAKTPDGETLFRLGFAGTPASLNPYSACDPEAETAISLLYDTLFSEDLTTGEPVGSLCTEYTVTNASSGVGKLWNITIRDDVYWSDGERLTSGDVEFSLQSLKDLSARYGYPRASSRPVSPESRFCRGIYGTNRTICDMTSPASPPIR